MLCGEPAALSEMVMAAWSAPAFVGAKWPWIVQFAPAARLVPQELANTKEAALVPVTAMLVMDKAAVPVLVIVTDWELLDAPTVVAGKLRVVADRVTGGVTPVPLNAMVCGEPVALSEMVMDAVSAPAVVGPKWPWMVQFAPAARLVPHEFAKTNEEALEPVTAMLEMERAADALLVRVTVCEALIEPTFTLPKERLVAERVTACATPVPVNATVCGDPAALSVMVMAACNGPEESGPKWPWMEQFAPTAKLVPHEFAKTNEEALVPVTAMLEIATAALPVFVITTVCDALVAPTFSEPKERLVVERVTGGVTPVPLNETVCGDPVALSATFRVPLSEPVVVGFNSTEMVQLAPAANVAPQVLADLRNELALAPVKLVELRATTAALVFLSVTSWGAEAVPFGVEPNVKLAGVSVTVSAPVPLKAKDCGDPGALSAMDSDAVRVPAANGLKVMVMEQEALIASVVPQVFV